MMSHPLSVEAILASAVGLLLLLLIAVILAVVSTTPDQDPEQKSRWPFR